MPSFKELSRSISLLFVLMIINSCTMIGAKSNQDIYYTTQPVAYIRKSPGYDSPQVATVYRGEQVVILSTGADDWRQIQTVQSGQIGWIQSSLLSSLPIPAQTYYVQADKVPLQNISQKEAPFGEVLYRGDKVRKLSENGEGWWQVLVEKDGNLGWLPATEVSERKPETAPPMRAAEPARKGSTKVPASPQPVANQLSYYVATASLNLHRLPLVSSQVVKTLKFNDKVEKIDQSGSQWLKVRYPETGAQGWAQGFFLADSSLKTPRVFPQHRRTPVKRPVCPKPGEPEKTQPEEVEPEVM